jgi:hypothetical protein
MEKMPQGRKTTIPSLFDGFHDQCYEPRKKYVHANVVQSGLVIGTKSGKMAFLPNGCQQRWGT